MLRLENRQLSLWESVLPENIKKLSDELETISGILSDPRFFEPYRRKFNTRIGRPTVPIDVYHRLMYLKFRYQLGYESLVKEVTDSISWRLFCRIPLDGQVPHSTTLIKLTHKYGAEIVDEVNQLVLEKAKQQKLLRGKKLRVDTTVTESDIKYPTDAGLLADGIKVITRTAKKLTKAGKAVEMKFRDQTGGAKKRLLEIGKVLRRRSGKAVNEVNQITAKLIQTTKTVIDEAQELMTKATEQSCQTLSKQLKQQLEITQKVVQQAEQVVSGNRHLKDRIVSIYDTDARPICKGSLKRPTQFGGKVLLGDTDDRLITAYKVYKGNPSDESLLPIALQEHCDRLGCSPWELATDRGFYSKGNEQLCTETGIRRVSMPHKGKPSANRREYQKNSWFKRLQRWRSGQEGVISYLKRTFGLDRSRFRGHEGMKIWVGFGVMAHNLRQMTE